MSKHFYRLFYPSLLISAYVYGKIQGGFASWFIFYVILLLNIYLWIVVKYSLNSFELYRTIKKSRLTSGDDIQVQLEFWNLTKFPHMYLIINDYQPDRLTNNSVRKQIVYPWFNEQVYVRYSIPNSIRGIHEWGKVEVITGDIFGLVKIKKEIDIASEAIVYPKIHPINEWKLRNDHHMGVLNTNDRVSDDTASVISIREYRRGDRFNKIHWKQSAKVMDLMTKEFERVYSNDIVITLNQREDLYENKAHFEAAVELVGSLASYAVQNKVSTGLISEGNIKKVVPLTKRKEDIIHIFDVLAVIEPDSIHPFGETISSEIKHFPMGVTLSIVTPVINEELATLVKELSRRRNKIELFVMYLTREKVIGQADIFNKANINVRFIPAKSWSEVGLARRGSIG